MTTALELLGLALLAVGFGMLAPWLGVATAGASCILLGLALDRAGDKPSPPDGE